MNSTISRRRFLTGTGALAGAGIAGGSLGLSHFDLGARAGTTRQSPDQTGGDYTLHIKNSAIEIAPKRIISATTYNGQFPGPLLRFKEGRQHSCPWPAGNIVHAKSIGVAFLSHAQSRG